MGDNSKKRLSVERIYQKKSQLEHILLRPDTYIGSVQTVTEPMWVYDEEEGMVKRETTYVPGLYKIFDEILVNAADNKQRDAKMNLLKIDINPEENVISVHNNGKGIPVEMHKEEKMYVPTMIFGHLLTGSNFNDDEQRVTGGRNGFGAKLCNVFSTKFTVETADKNTKRSFKQTWGSNMGQAGEAKIKDYNGEDFTRVTFSPDLSKFGMERLDKDTVALLSRRAFDIAATTKGVKVFLNGKQLPIKSFKDYVDQFVKGKTDDAGNPLKVVHDQCGERWEVAICVSSQGFQQMSFVNSIATIKGGKHVDHVTDLVVKCLQDSINKKDKTGMKISPKQIKDHMWVFIVSLIENPTFDSQSKETMTLVAKSFGSKCELTEKFRKEVSKTGIIDSVLLWSKFRADNKLGKAQVGRKTSKLTGIPKLDDANEAGTKNGLGCTLILTEGDSAKTLAVSGISVVGKDYYGVYPLKGKLLNVREANIKQVTENKEICDLIKIIGLKYKRNYETIDDLKELRYGKVMIMTDQDQDGSHIKGLVINFIHHNWPSLLKLPFLEEFITPIVKVTKGNNSLSFYSLPEFVEWKDSTENFATWKVKYYKGLGTSTSKEAKEYFTDMARHKIKFTYNGAMDDNAITLAFSKKRVDERKEWLTDWMEEGRRRKEANLPEVYLYEKDTKAVNYQDFVNKELVLFSNMDNERSIPSLVDGFKPGQRKVFFTCLKRNLVKEIKVAQLAGSVSEKSAYHHGEASLMGTIIGLAQNFVGSNNINLLMPVGQFGTRLTGGKDAASPRYIFTQLSPLARVIFNVKDDPLLNYLKDDNLSIEPSWYMPLIPMVLVNGADGIGTGWATKIPNYNPREIVANLERLLKGEEIKEMLPWFKNFRGSFAALGQQRYVCNGEIATLGENKLEITELPVRTWTTSYKEDLEKMMTGDEKSPAQIQDFRDHNTDQTIRMIVQMDAEKMRAAELGKGLHSFFKLQTTMSTTSMVLFDHMGVLRTYATVEDILKEFFSLRLEYYGKRKAYFEGLLGAEASRLSNQARFILEKCKGDIRIENKKKKVMIEELVRKKYDSDPVKAWKKSLNTEEEEEDGDGDEDEDAESSQASKTKEDKGPDYDYLLGMPMWNLTQEKIDEICKKRDEKIQELKTLQATTKEQLFKVDLKEFLVKLDEVEEKERKEAEQGGDDSSSAGSTMKGGKKGGKGKNKGQVKADTLPSKDGIRVEPKMDVLLDSLKERVEKAAAAKERKANKEKGLGAVKSEKVKDEIDEATGEKKAKTKKVKSDGMKQTTLPFKKKANPWSDDDSDAGSGGDSDISDVKPREKTEGRKAAAVKRYADDSESDDDEELPLPKKGRSAVDAGIGDVEEASGDKPAIDKDEFDVSDSDDADFESKAKGKAPVKKMVAEASKPAQSSQTKKASNKKGGAGPSEEKGAKGKGKNQKKMDQFFSPKS